MMVLCIFNCGSGMFKEIHFIAIDHTDFILKLMHNHLNIGYTFYNIKTSIATLS